MMPKSLSRSELQTHIPIQLLVTSPPDKNKAKLLFSPDNSNVLLPLFSISEISTTIDLVARNKIYMLFLVLHFPAASSASSGDSTFKTSPKYFYFSSAPYSTLTPSYNHLLPRPPRKAPQIR